MLGAKIILVYRPEFNVKTGINGKLFTFIPTRQY